MGTATCVCVVLRLTVLPQYVAGCSKHGQVRYTSNQISGPDARAHGLLLEHLLLLVSVFAAHCLAAFKHLPLLPFSFSARTTKVLPMHVCFAATSHGSEWPMDHCTYPIPHPPVTHASTASRIRPICCICTMDHELGPAHSTSWQHITAARHLPGALWVKQSGPVALCGLPISTQPGAAGGGSQHSI